MSFNPLLPVPANEAERLQTLDAFAVLDTAPEAEFDRIVALASRIFDVPIALVSLVARDRQFFKAKVGLNACETGRDVSFCSFAILQQSVMVVPDARLDPRFHSNALVTGDLGIRFYAGAPLVTPAGHALGSLCLIDREPRHGFSEGDQRTLMDLADLVMERLELRRLQQAHVSSRTQFENIAATSPDAIVCADGTNTITSWNAAAERIFGYAAGEAIGQSLSVIVPPAMRSHHASGLARVANGGAPRILGTSLTLTACRHDGTEFPIELSLSQWSEDGAPRFGAIVRDITGRKEAEARLKHAAEFDHLTGLANRVTLRQHMETTCQEDRRATVLLLDLDGFKDVNDRLGHLSGDHVLQVVAERLDESAGKTGMIARLGGDEFVVFAADIADPLQATAFGERLIAAVETPIAVDEQLVHLSTSVGIAFRDRPGCSAEQLLGNADLALYRAKADGRGRVRLFTPALRQTANMRGDIGVGLREAWENGCFELFYQPQVQLSDGVLIGAEALIRWHRPYQGLVMPGAFLPILESSPLAGPVGTWILRTACGQAACWRRSGHASFRMGVNLFAAQFWLGDLPEVVERALADFGLPADALELEVTENIILRNEQRIIEQLAQLRNMGVGIAFDDFGTGYASLTMLKNYPVTRLKIDRSFVSGIENSRKDQAIVDAVARMAAGLELGVIAEGIETEGQARLLAGHCAEGQGYLFGRPMTAGAFEDRFCQGRSWAMRAAS